jgi:predicted nuclease of predicted toxin-antitoxin system
VKLLLDEMISWRIAAQLRSAGHDVVAVKRDRHELEHQPDGTILEAATAEQRAVVTNNVRDFRVAHERILARGETHYGVIYTFDSSLPRNKAGISLWVTMLERFLRTHEPDDALVNRTLALQ